LSNLTTLELGIYVATHKNKNFEAFEFPAELRDLRLVAPAAPLTLLAPALPLGLTSLMVTQLDSPGSVPADLAGASLANLRYTPESYKISGSGAQGAIFAAATPDLLPSAYSHHLIVFVVSADVASL